MYQSSVYQECTFDWREITIGSSRLTGSSVNECEESFVSCCRSYESTKYCTKGITQALNSSFCPYLAWSPLPSVKDRISRSCCESCLKGMSDQEAKIDCNNKSPSQFNNTIEYNVYLDCCSRKLSKITSATLVAHETEEAATDVAIDSSINPSTRRTNLPQRLPTSSDSIYRSTLTNDSSLPCSRVNRCAHFCIDASPSIPKHCACREGYLLGEDGGSCRSSSTVYTSFRSSSSSSNPQQFSTDVNRQHTQIEPCIISPTQVTSNVGTNDNNLLEQHRSREPTIAKTLHTPATVIEEHEDTVRQSYSSEVTRYETQSRGRVPPHHSSTDYHQQQHAVTSTYAPGDTLSGYISPSCSTGFKWDRNRRSCIDIDECRELNPGPCHTDTETCVNYDGGFYCRKVINQIPSTERNFATEREGSSFRSTSCSDGLRFDAERSYCVDIDECEENRHNCHHGTQICRNTYGNYTCDCSTGYKKLDTNICADIDECSDVHYTLCPRQESTCFNTPGSYKCLCKDGFRESGRSNSCNDIDECLENPNICGSNSICLNTYGSYKCRCQHGFKLSSDGKSCDDIDECSSNLRLCIGICDNIPGSYSCRCPSGFRLDPSRRICEDIDECRETNPCHGGETCLNTIGSVKCYSINCPSGYYQDTNRSNRCVKRLINQSYDTQTQVVRYGNEPHYITFNHLTLSCNLTDSSRSFYDFIFDSTSDDNYIYDLKVLDVRAPPNVRRASNDDFIIRRSGKSGASIHVSGLRSINGPQDIDLEFTVKTKTGETFYKSLLTIYVAQYDGVNF